MSFKVGDKVTVIRKPSTNELAGWDNEWVESMDAFVGNAYTIWRIDNAQKACQFEDSSRDFPPYSFPFCALLKVENPAYKEKLSPENRYRYSRGIKYQYLHNGDYETDDLCISVLTHIIRDKDGNAIVYWAVAYKNPKDQFNKQLARQILSTKPLEQFLSPHSYTRDEILLFILTELYQSNSAPIHYRRFILENMRRLLNYGNLREFL